MTPEQKLIKAICGKLPEEMTIEEKEAAIERAYERQANSVTDEEFKEMWGISIKESVDKSMLFAGWCDSVMRWKRDNATNRKYTISDSTPEFTLKQVCDMVQHFYHQGVEDGKNGVSEYDRLWKINR